MKVKKQDKKKFTKNEVLERYKSILDHIEDGYCELDLAGNIILFNDSLRRILGYSAEELTGMNYRQYISPENVQRVYEFFHDLYLTGTPGKLIDYEVITKDGSRRTVEASVSVIRDASGAPIRFRSLGRDVTERKQSEEELRKSEEKYRTILDAIEEGYFEVDLTGNFTFVNNHLQKIADETREELLRMNYMQYTSPETAKEMYHVFNTIYRTGEPVKIRNFEIIRMNGTKRICELSVALMRDAKGKPIGFRGINRDVTDRKQAEEMYRTIADKSFAGIFIIQKGVFQYANANVVAYTGYTVEELIGMESMKLVLPDDRAILKQHATEMLKGNSKSPYEYRIVTKDGVIKWIIEMVTPIMIRGEQAVLGSSMDITERKQAELLLRESNERFNALFDRSLECVYIHDLNGNFIDVNQGTLDLLGYNPEEVRNLNFASLVDAEQLHIAIQTMKNIIQSSAQSGITEFRIKCKDGSYRDVETSGAVVSHEGKPYAILGVARDITERKQAEVTLRENEERYRLSFENASDVIFIIDRDTKITSISPSVKKILDYEPKEFVERSIEALTNIIAPESMDAALSSTIKVLNGEDIQGANFTFIARDGTKKIGEVSASPIIRSGVIMGALVIARDITDRKLAEDALEDSLKNLRRALGATIQAVAVMVEARDPYTAGHQRRVTDLARSIATEMGLPREQVDGLRMASTIHDIGKISIPAEILSKPSKLTDLEFKLIKTHAQSGYDMLKGVEFPWPIARMILEHHERINGTGYPNGLKREQILLESRILMVADVVEAMGSHRPYRPAKGIELALEEISKNRGILYDPEVADACLKLFDEKGYKLVQ